MKHATITIDTGNIIGDVHDHIYGANLEHLGQAVYGGVWGGDAGRPQIRRQ